MNLALPLAKHSAYTLAMATAEAVATSVATASAELSAVVTSGESQMYAVVLAAAAEDAPLTSERHSGVGC